MMSWQAAPPKAIHLRAFGQRGLFADMQHMDTTTAAFVKRLESVGAADSGGFERSMLGVIAQFPGPAGKEATE